MPEATDGEPPPLLDAEWVEAVTDRIAERGLILGLDFDGTLAPIVDDPDEAVLFHGNRKRLRRFAEAPDATVVVVSGRALPDLRDRIRVDDVKYAGNHGLELGVEECREVPAAARDHRAGLEDVIDRLREVLGPVPGCTIEDKTFTATVHLRGVPNDRRAAVVSAVEDIVEPMDSLRTSDGRAIVEIRPDSRLDKGWVIERLRETQPERVPLFVGDDVTDEDGFRAVADRDGGVLVGDRTDTAAAVRVPGPETVATLLDTLADAVDAPTVD